METEPGRAGAGDNGSAELVQALQRLRSHLQGADVLFSQVAAAAKRLGGVEQQAGELSARIAELESDRDLLAQRLVEADRQTGRLMTLYVATYQLHATLNPEEVQSTIVDIALNLLGAERFVLLMREEGADVCEVALREGIPEDADPRFAKGIYRGGDAVLDATLTDGVLRLGPLEGSDVIAAVPLRVQDVTVGALVILKLLDHKPSFQSDDRELLDLMAAHAASALFASRVYSATTRKLQTLESLMKLVKRS